MNHQRMTVIGMIIFLVAIGLISAVYYYMNRPDPDAVTYEPVTDEVLQREVAPDLPAADGYGDEDPIISSVVDLTSRGLSTQQATYFTTNFIEFISESDIKHDQMMRIEKSSVERINDRDNNRVVTQFVLYITEDVAYKVSLTNSYGEREEVDILVADDSDQTIYRQTAD